MKKELSPLSHSIPSAFLFLLIGLFAVSSITLTLIGTRVYRRVTDTAAHNSDSQMVLSYLCNKVRTFDKENSVKFAVNNILNRTEEMAASRGCLLPYRDWFITYERTF